MPHSQIAPRIRNYARQSRLQPTSGEKEMWTYLRSFRPYGAHFRRQAPIGSYIADFAWLSARLVIEVDGATHESPERQESDRRKDAFLREEGFQVFRISGNDVAANSVEAFSKLEAAIRSRLDTPPLAPPHKGEG